MTKNQVKLSKLSDKLLAVAPKIANQGCAFFVVGEPKLPKKLKKQ